MEIEHLYLKQRLESKETTESGTQTANTLPLEICVAQQEEVDELQATVRH